MCILCVYETGAGHKYREDSELWDLRLGAKRDLDDGKRLRSLQTEAAVEAAAVTRGLTHRRFAERSWPIPARILYARRVINCWRVDIYREKSEYRSVGFRSLEKTCWHFKLIVKSVFAGSELSGGRFGRGPLDPRRKTCASNAQAHVFISVLCDLGVDPNRLLSETSDSDAAKVAPQLHKTYLYFVGILSTECRGVTRESTRTIFLGILYQLDLKK